MKRSSRPLSSLAAIFLAALASAAVGQDFSETRLREGKEAYRAHRAVEAIDELRIAAFGFLDRPPLLCESLVYLALANEEAGRQAEAQGAVERLFDVERRLPACGQAKLDQAARSEFESRFHRLLPAWVPAAAPPKSAGSAGPPASEATPRAGGQKEPEAAGEDFLTPARIKESVPPVYPPAARQARVGGTVTLRVLVSEAGRPLRVEVGGGVRPDLDDAAVAAVRRWTFDPARRNGREVPAWTTVEVRFRP